jgi:pyridoxal phosphate enzyme (YggS family)
VTTIEPAVVAARVAAVRERIDRAGGQGVRLVAVTKAFPIDAVLAALRAGVDDIGENYAQELLGKVPQLADHDVAPDRVRWHFLGRLQRNKVRALAPHVHLWQSVDRAELGAEIAKRAPGAAVLVQVNLADEPQKGGCSWADLHALVRELGEMDLDVRGLMGVGPAGPPEAARPGFRRLVATAAELGLDECSIGMTDDLEVAVEEGSTMVRIGRDLFGPRPYPLGRR